MTAKTETRHSKGAGWRYVYEALHNEILTLKLQPGQLLDESSLAARFNMSRSPVREALIRLLGDELVVTLSNRSTIVAPIEISSFPKYVEALDIAQRMNTRLAAKLRTEEDIKNIKAKLTLFDAAAEARDYLAMSGTNKDLHMAIAQAGRNPYLASFYERLLNQGRRMLHLHFDFLERDQEGHLLTDEHWEMLEAIQSRDVERADQLAHDHTRQFRDRFINYMKESFSSGFSLDVAQDVRTV